MNGIFRSPNHQNHFSKLTKWWNESQVYNFGDNKPSIKQEITNEPIVSKVLPCVDGSCICSSRKPGLLKAGFQELAWFVELDGVSDCQWTNVHQILKRRYETRYNPLDSNFETLFYPHWR
jgi:hypothetical protein